ncbi:MAG: GNAT family N-acetyltransferase [Acidimicrobiales bacterium]
MPGAADTPAVRTASPSEFGRLRWIEIESDRLYDQVGIGPFVNDEAENHLAVAATVLVAGDPAVGFVSLEIVDGAVHIDQLSVLPSHGRRGIGLALLDEATCWARTCGHHTMTLTAFRDVPWNAPFYRRHGFETMSDPGPGLAAIREHEREVGLDAHGPRVAMRLAL